MLGGAHHNGGGQDGGTRGSVYFSGVGKLRIFGKIQKFCSEDYEAAAEVDFCLGQFCFPC